MAKVKNSEQKVDASPAKMKATESPAKKKGPAKKGKENVAKNNGAKKDGVAKKTISKPKLPSSSEMVTDALKSLKNRKGVSMPAIYRFLAENYGWTSTKRSRNHIHDFMDKEFVAGNIEMVDDDSQSIKFNGHYKWVD